jgi:serine/threonine-protein kinase RsbW
MKHQQTFANTPSAVARARHFVVRQLGDAPGEVVDGVAIMVSELATNCVRHTVTDFTVAVEYARDEIRVEVTDSGGGMPTVRRPESSEPSGRGLRIVQELADSFGVRERTGAPGKTVWFVMTLDDTSIDPAARSLQVLGGPSDEPSPGSAGPLQHRMPESADTAPSPEACDRRRGTTSSPRRCHRRDASGRGVQSAATAPRSRAADGAPRGSRAVRPEGVDRASVRSHNVDADGPGAQ